MKIDTSEVDRLSQRLSEFAKELKDPTGLSKLCALLVVQGVQGNYRAQKNADGTAWPVLRYRVGTPLVNKLGRMPKGTTYRIEKSGFVVGAGEATKAYNRVHNEGSVLWNSGAKWDSGKFKGKRKGIPQRQYMYISAATYKRVVQAASVYVRKMVGRV